MTYEPLKEPKPERVFVTGAAGFGASGIISALLDRGYHVTGLDQCAPAHADLLLPVFSKYRGNFRYLWKNLQDIRAEDLEDHQIVIHLAAQADVPMGFMSPAFTASQNILSTVTLLTEATHVKGITKFFYASSGNAIGRPQYLPIDEKHPLTPHNPYAWSKAAAEMAVWAWQRAYDIPAVVMSNGVVIGPNMRREIFIFKWLWNAYHGKPIVVEGGEQTRDVTYVDDAISGWLLALEAPAADVVGQKFQISYGREISVRELAFMCRDATKTDVPIEFVGYRPGEKGQRECFNNEKARRVLRYNPSVGPEEAIKLTSDWVRTLCNRRVVSARFHQRQAV